MRHRIYHSLDRSPSVFGIRGRFLVPLLTGAGMSGVLGLAAGKATEMLAGICVAAAGCAAAYLGVISMQAKVDERDIMKVHGHRRMPECWSTRPSALRNVWKGIN